MTRIIKIFTDNNFRMKPLSLSVVLNTLLSFFVVFLFLTVVVSFFRIKTWLKIAISAIISVSIAVIIFYKNNERYSKTQKLKTANLALSETKRVFNLLSEEQIASIFFELCKKLQLSPTLSDGFLIIEDAAIFPLFYPEDLSFENVKKIANKTPSFIKKIIVVSDGFTKTALDFKKELSMIFVKSEEAIKLLEKFDLVPKKERPIVKKENLFLRLFKKTNGKKFILYGVGLLILSLFAFYRLYYLISGGVFILFGLIATFFAKKDDFISTQKDFLQILNSLTENT